MPVIPKKFDVIFNHIYSTKKRTPSPILPETEPPIQKRKSEIEKPRRRNAKNKLRLYLPFQNLAPGAYIM